jgi:hypothetical protein
VLLPFSIQVSRITCFSCHIESTKYPHASSWSSIIIIGGGGRLIAVLVVVSLVVLNAEKERMPGDFLMLSEDVDVTFVEGFEAR